MAAHRRSCETGARSLAVLGGAPAAAAALLMFAAIGVGDSLVDIGAYTLAPRSAPDAAIARAFAALEALVTAAPNGIPSVQCDGVATLRSVPAQPIEELAAGMQRAVFGPGATVVEEGAADASVSVVTAGQAEVTRAGALVAHLAPGQCFGDLPRTGTVRGRDERRAPCRRVGPRALPDRRHRARDRCHARPVRRPGPRSRRRLRPTRSLVTAVGRRRSERPDEPQLADRRAAEVRVPHRPVGPVAGGAVEGERPRVALVEGVCASSPRYVEPADPAASNTAPIASASAEHAGRMAIAASAMQAKTTPRGGQSSVATGAEQPPRGASDST